MSVRAESVEDDDFFCNCCGTNNGPWARHDNYWICDDCAEKYGYDGAVRIAKAKISSGYWDIPEDVRTKTEADYEKWKKRWLESKRRGSNDNN